MTFGKYASGTAKGGNWRDVPISHGTIMQLLPCRDAIAVGAADPGFGLISPAGEKRLWLEGSKPDMRDKLDENFTLSEDGSKVRFGLGYGSENLRSCCPTSGGSTGGCK